MSHYQFQKRCTVCKDLYYKNLISKEAFENVAENPAIEVNLSTEPKTATIDSKCDKHVDDA